MLLCSESDRADARWPNIATDRPVGAVANGGCRRHANGRIRREGNIGQPANEGPVSDAKATSDDTALTGSFCPV
jgi:hypothetical protein